MNRQPIRFLFLTTKLAVNGASRVLRGQIRELTRRGHQISLATLWPNDSNRFQAAGNIVPIAEVSHWRGDCVVSHHPATHHLLATVAVPLRLAYFQCVPADVGWPKDGLDEICQLRSEGLVVAAVSTHVADWLEARGIRASVIHPAIDDTFIQCQARDQYRPHILLVEGSEKDYKRVATAYEWAPANWQIWGISRFDHNHPRCDRMYVDPSDAELIEIYSSALVLVKLSDSEGFGLPLLEAMACGCIVICRDMGGNLDYCHHGNNCLIIRNRTEFHTALQRIEYDNSLRFRLTSRGRLTARLFTWRRSVNHLLGVLGRSAIGDT